MPHRNAKRETEKQKASVGQGYVSLEVAVMLKGRSSVCLSVCLLIRGLSKWMGSGRNPRVDPIPVCLSVHQRCPLVDGVKEGFARSKSCSFSFISWHRVGTRCHIGVRCIWRKAVHQG